LASGHPVRWPAALDGVLVVSKWLIGRVPLMLHVSACKPLIWTRSGSRFVRVRARRLLLVLTALFLICS
jgi:hypothetical protein